MLVLAHNFHTSGAATVVVSFRMNANWAFEKDWSVASVSSGAKNGDCCVAPTARLYSVLLLESREVHSWLSFSFHSLARARLLDGQETSVILVGIKNCLTWLIRDVSAPNRPVLQPLCLAANDEDDHTPYDLRRGEWSAFLTIHVGRVVREKGMLAQMWVTFGYHVEERWFTRSVWVLPLRSVKCRVILITKAMHKMWSVDQVKIR